MLGHEGQKAKKGPLLDLGRRRMYAGVLQGFEDGANVG